MRSGELASRLYYSVARGRGLTIATIQAAALEAWQCKHQLATFAWVRVQELQLVFNHSGYVEPSLPPVRKLEVRLAASRRLRCSPGARVTSRALPGSGRKPRRVPRGSE